MAENTPHRGVFSFLVKISQKKSREAFLGGNSEGFGGA
jgi:hypothetical protein